MDPFHLERAAIIASLGALEVEDIPSSEAAGRWLAEPVRAAVAAPPNDCSAMDGYALRAADLVGRRTLPIRRTIYAGDPPGDPLPPGEGVRIFTGAPLPPGADVVIREEEVTTAEPGSATFIAPAPRGDNVRRAGEDVPAGGVALESGTRLGPRQQGLLHAVGVTRVKVRRRPRVLVLSTGDEVVSGRTPDSNGLAVARLCEVVGAHSKRVQAADRLGELQAALATGVAESDLTITIGGVSSGVRDLVPAALRELGAEVKVHRVRMKPGKPFLFATLAGRPIFCLPGSPSACLVTFEVFARPAILALLGAGRLVRKALRLRLSESLPGRPGRARLVWAALAEDGRVRPLGRDTAQVRGPALADALLVVPADVGRQEPGEEVVAWLLEDA